MNETGKVEGAISEKKVGHEKIKKQLPKTELGYVRSVARSCCGVLRRSNQTWFVLWKVTVAAMREGTLGGKNRQSESPGR